MPNYIAGLRSSDGKTIMEHSFFISWEDMSPECLAEEILRRAHQCTPIKLSSKPWIKTLYNTDTGRYELNEPML